MLYPGNIEEKIGFDKIRNLLLEKCLSDLGRHFVKKMNFTTDFIQIKKWLKQTEEFKKILELGEPFPSSNYIDASHHLDQAKIPGTFLSEEAFFDLVLSLKTILFAINFLKQKKDLYPGLFEVADQIFIDPALVKKISAIIDEKGEIKDNASPELSRIRSEISSQQNRLRKVLNQILQKSVQLGITDQDVSVTIKNGRMVIPVNATYKKQLKGIVQDESATGQTVFIEPTESLDINNDIRELLYREKREIIKILTELTEEVRPYFSELKKAYRFLGIIDFVRAKAKLAIELQCEIVELTDTPQVTWHEARHPLLFLAHQQNNKPIVPLNIRIDAEQRILVVSGPNAGGKSVCLKTIGLIQYMLQCGLLVPVKESSRMGLFSQIFIDIGDEQSIENDLSTYSSHLTNMKYFVQHTNASSLFLIDEFGTGTEPQIGGAVAESILEELNQKRAMGVITTHYGNLKKFADQHAHVVNAAMRFDLDKLEPLFELEIGKPGSSFALEIAQKIGLPNSILAKAKDKAGYQQIKFDKMLAELEWEKRQYDEKMVHVNQQDQKLKQLIQEYNGLKEVLDNNKKKLLNEAKAQAQRLFEEANQKIENTIREIKQNQADKEATKKVRKDLENFQKQFHQEPEFTKPQSEKIEVIEGPLNVGDWVRIKGQEAVGQVDGIKGKDVEITIGQLKSKIKSNRLEKISRREAKKAIPEPVSSLKGVDINQKMASFNPNLDLRGKRTEEAIPRIDQFIDNALLLGYRDLRIVHGKGDGILRKMIRDYLQSIPTIKKYKDENVERGGAGVTLVELKQ